MFVLGGTGAIGGHVIPTLVGQGRTVTALARTPAKAAMLTAQGAGVVSVSMFDRQALAAAFTGMDAVANLTSAIPPMTRFLWARAWRDNDRVRSQGSAAVVDAAVAAGVGRVLQESVSMLYHDHGAGWIDEDAPIDRYPRAGANLAAETSATRFTAAGGTGVVLRFGWFYGPGAAHSEQLLALARRHLGVVLGPPDGYVSSIHVADGAVAVAAALHGLGGRSTWSMTSPLTKRDHAAAMAAAVGTDLWLRVPGRAGLLAGDRLTSLTRSLRVSNTRFRSATGWAPRYPSARQGWIATAQLLDH